MIITTFHAIFKDGSFLTMDDLQEAKNLPKCDFIVRKTGSNNSPYNCKYEFIDFEGNLSALKVGEVELIKLKYNADNWYYVLFHQGTQTYKSYTVNNRKNFPWYNFFEKELLPQMGELSRSPEYVSLYFNKKLNDVIEKIETITDRLDFLEKNISPKSNGES